MPRRRIPEREPALARWLAQQPEWLADTFRFWFLIVAIPFALLCLAAAWFAYLLVEARKFFREGR
jgi:hypothetical protein